jgi:tetratricopeptide (TPR) repeat protein
VLGDIYYGLGQYADAAEAYRAATEYPFTTLEYYLDACINSGTLYLKAQQYDAAITQYQKALAADSNTVEAYYNLGQAYLAKRDTARVVLYWTRLLELHPNDPDAENIRAKLSAMRKH